MPTGSTSYPGGIDDLGTVKADGDLVGQELVNASAAIEAIEAELGTTPSGSESTVAARFTTVEGGLAAHIADTADAHDASAISILDAANDFTATDVEAALAELQSDAEAHLADSSAAHAASAVSFSPTGSIAATDVQAAIAEVASEASGSGIPATTVDVKGDLIAATAADTVARLAAGANGTVLTAASGETTGLIWATPATGAGRIINAEDYGFTAYANNLDVDTPWTNLLAALAGGTPQSTTVVFPPGLFGSDSEIAFGTTQNVRLIGSGAGPNQSNGINRYHQTIFQLNGSGTRLMSFDGGSTLVKGGFQIDNCTFYWNGSASAVALYVNNHNDWSLRNCGFSGKNSSGTNWDKAIQLQATGGVSPDNAHGLIDQCFSYGNSRFLDGITGLGVNVTGGEIIGDSGSAQYGFYIDDLQELTVVGTKCVGCLGGVAYVTSGYNTFVGVRGENCGDATHPVMHFVDGSTGAGGDYNKMFGCTFTGSAASLPTLLDTGTSWSYLVGNVHAGMDNHSGLAANEVKNSGGVTNVVKDQMTEKIGGYSGYKVGFFGTEPVVRQGAYSVSGLVADRTFNAASTSAAELGHVVGTLIADLTALGLLGSSP